MLNQLSSLIGEIDAEEEEHTEPLRLEAVMKRYTSGNKTVRRIYITEKFNEKDDLDRYDRALVNDQRYCIVTIRLLPKATLVLHAEK
ncbi:MAG: hypothetical protein JRN52_08575 [Nitrososphaerota archaeon]|nr:hypothetical protein [Nitrososphaerota archaeon]